MESQNRNYPFRPFVEAIFNALPKEVRDYILGIEVQISMLMARLNTLEKEKQELLVRNQELENRLHRDSSNSNRPPSTDPPYNKGKKQKQKANRDSDQASN